MEFHVVFAVQVFKAQFQWDLGDSGGGLNQHCLQFQLLQSIIHHLAPPFVEPKRDAVGHYDGGLFLHRARHAQDFSPLLVSDVFSEAGSPRALIDREDATGLPVNYGELNGLAGSDLSVVAGRLGGVRFRCVRLFRFHFVCRFGFSSGWSRHWRDI